LIASDDLDALDAFEDLLNALSDPMLFPTNDYTVFYLKFAKADQAAKLLNDLVSGGGAALDTIANAGFGSLLDSAASALEISGPLQIVPDTRINALIIKGETGDIELIRQLLTVIDQEHSPENVQTTAPPRLIPIFNASATDVAAVVKEIYASRMAGANSGGGGQRDRQNFEQMIAAMRSGRGGPSGRGGGGRQQAEQTEPELTVGVDARSNSLIVSAPEPLFQEIKALVSQLDEVAIESNEVTRVVTVTRANPESIQKALESLFGGGSASANSAARNGGSGAARRDASAEAQDRMRRRMDFFNAMQRGGGPGGFGRGGGPGSFGRGVDFRGRGGGDRGRGDRGGGDRGGGGRGGR
jgi:type II secretory pathway component GspD/PulD (secretin)